MPPHTCYRKAETHSESHERLSTNGKIIAPEFFYPARGFLVLSERRCERGVVRALDGPSLRFCPSLYPFFLPLFLPLSLFSSPTSPCTGGDCPQGGPAVRAERAGHVVGAIPGLAAGTVRRGNHTRCVRPKRISFLHKIKAVSIPLTDMQRVSSTLPPLLFVCIFF